MDSIKCVSWLQFLLWCQSFKVTFDKFRFESFSKYFFCFFLFWIEVMKSFACVSSLQESMKIRTVKMDRKC
jgi:hypothetical protein